MEDTEVKRQLYQDSEAFKAGVEVGRKEIVEKAYEHAKAKYDLDYCGNVREVLDYLKSLMEE